MDDRAIVALALRQHGLITRQQVLALGGSDQAIETLVRTGRWHRVRRGVFAVGAAPATWQRSVLAALLAAGDDTLASHRSAARLMGFVERSGRVELTTWGDRCIRLAGVTVHRSRLLPVFDRTIVDAIPVTTAARTIVDLAPSQPTETVGRWIDDARRRLHVDPLDVASCAARLAGPGRPSLRPLRRLLAERIPEAGPGDSVLEARALRVLVAAGLPVPVQQHRVVRPDGTLAFIDLAYPHAMVAIEVDGWSAHGGRSAFDADRVRANDLVALGWRVVRYTSAMPDHVLVRTVTALLGLDRAQ